jgi:hypothetical protein
MKFLIFNTDYQSFIRYLYAQNPGLESRDFDEQYRIRMDSLFGTADFYSTNLRKLGHEAWDVIANIEPMQKQWAREHGVDVENSTRWRLRLRRGVVPWLYHTHNQDWLYEILEAQVKAYRPDVLYCMCIETIGSDFLRNVKGYYRLAVGQHAATPLKTDISEYDLVLSSLPNQVDHFRRQGIKSELLLLGFEPRVLEKTKYNDKQFEIAFVGGLGGIHQNTTETIELLTQLFDFAVWGYGIKNLTEQSPVRKCFRGSLWGLEMYQVIRDSKIVFNRHSTLADLHFANNMRLYETTGVGTLLLTDYKQNLADMFEPGKEVIVYRDAEECAELAGYYLKHDDEREAIAYAGQQRTLKDHTYYKRMQDLVEIVRKYL